MWSTSRWPREHALAHGVELAQPELRMTIEEPAAPRDGDDSRDGLAKPLAETRSASGRHDFGEHSIAYVSV
jgi:hypothetical protein